MLKIMNRKVIDKNDCPCDYDAFYIEGNDINLNLAKIAYKKVYDISDGVIFAGARDDFDELFFVKISFCETFDSTFSDANIYSCEVKLSADAEVTLT